jgi:hypothetical protein
MALETTFRRLTHSLHEVHEMVNALRIMIEDKPEHDGAAVADDMLDHVLELMGCLREGSVNAHAAHQAMQAPMDLEEARRSLATCQSEFHTMERNYSANLVAYDKLKALLRAGGRDSEWSAWAWGTKLAIEQCGAPMHETSEAFASCWQELAERLGTMNISVRALSVGQQISSRPHAKERSAVASNP